MQGWSEKGYEHRGGHVNDLPCALNCSKVTMYADDTSLEHSAKDVKDITSTMNAEYENLKDVLHT